MRAFSGKVVEGKRLGRTIGFPTINLETECAPEMRKGVYAVRVQTDGGEYPGMMNIGSHPTSPEGPPTIEIHLLGFEGDLYGRSVRVQPEMFLREERKFASLEALSEQLKKDRAAVQTLIGGKNMTE